MEMDDFLVFLQQVLTMVDARDPGSIDLGNVALITVTGLARKSDRTSPMVLKTMEASMHLFGQLIAHREEFIPVPGETQKNQLRKQRLLKVIQPLV